jgi:hypothetical protein
MADYDSAEHDSYDENGYQQRCYCQKCVATYKEWCCRNKSEGVTHCKRRCFTICEIKCEKPVTTVTKWGYKKRYDGEWEKFRSEIAPKPCKSCKKEQKECRCKSHAGAEYEHDYEAEYADEQVNDYEEIGNYKAPKKHSRKQHY